MKITLLKYKVGNLDLEKLHHQDKKHTETFGGEESVHFQWSICNIYSFIW